MEDIRIRYGATLTMECTTDSTDATTADFIVGKPGETPKINKSFPVTDGVFVVELTATDTSLPLGEYRYQMNLLRADGAVEKFPSPTADDADHGLPAFYVVEALDEQETSA